MALILRGVAMLGLLSSASGAYSFVSVGDWGGASIGGYQKSNQIAVATQMGKTASDLDAQFVINTGDNFYYCGVQSLTDSQWKETFEDIFSDKSLNVPWYGVLGNHDYAYDIASQFAYKSPNNDRWQMPDRNFTKRVHLGGSNYATLVFFDSNVCIADYRGSDPKGWDPCSGEYGECKQPSDQTCHFHDHIVAVSCEDQYNWLKSTLDGIDESDWIIAVGHHEADSINVQDLTALLLARKVNLYLNGHTHALKHYQIDGNADIDWVTTGAGSMVYTKSQDLKDEDHICVNNTRTHTAKELWYKKVTGFTTHTFSDDFTSLKTEFLGIDGSTLYSFTTSKTKGIVV